MSQWASVDTCRSFSGGFTTSQSFMMFLTSDRRKPEKNIQTNSNISGRLHVKDIDKDVNRALGAVPPLTWRLFRFLVNASEWRILYWVAHMWKANSRGSLDPTVWTLSCLHTAYVLITNTLTSASTAWPEDQPSAHPRETSENEQEATSCQGGTAQDDGKKNHLVCNHIWWPH